MINFLLNGQVSNQFVDAEIPQWPVIVNPGAFVPDQLLVMLYPNSVIGEVESQFEQNGLTVIAQKNCSTSMRIWTITFVANTNLSQALILAKSFPSIQLAQFNHYCAHRASIPNDAQFSSMWNMNNTGQNGGLPDADIDATEAWDISTGGMTVLGDTIVVAVIDAGFDLNHADLNFKKNYGEIPNNNIDDDGNGYIDDFDGWNAYNSNGIIVSDLHGTHVAGIVGARGNNSIGVVGVNWGVKIMPVMGSDGTEAQVVEAYSYVFDSRKLYNNTNGLQGAFVVATNSSFGVDLGQPAAYPIWCAMYDSLGQVGILSAAATANQNWDIDVVGDIPTACSSNYLISVTNTDRNDLKFSSAGYGDTTIDVGAPGTQIESTLPFNAYGMLSGTSMASPHVAGAIALMYAAACSQSIVDYKNNPDSVALLFKNYLLSNVDQISSLSSNTTSGGRLNIYNSLLAVQSVYNCSTIGIEPVENETSINFIFPNPSCDFVKVVFSSTINTNGVIILTDLLGQNISSTSAVIELGNNSVSLDVSGLSAGIYFLRIDGAGEVSNTMRLVVE